MIYLLYAKRRLRGLDATEKRTEETRPERYTERDQSLLCL